jgi:uncharacterized protein (TIGR02271 family)
MDKPGVAVQAGRAKASTRRAAAMPAGDAAAGAQAAEGPVLRLHAEEVSVARRRKETGRVRVQVRTTSRDHLVDEELAHERVRIERVAIGRVVAAAPPVRQEGDTTVIPVVEEIVVVERRLVLKEEVRLTRVRVAGRHREAVALRTQEATVTRGVCGASLLADAQPPAGKRGR